MSILLPAKAPLKVSFVGIFTQLLPPSAFQRAWWSSQAAAHVSALAQVGPERVTWRVHTSSVAHPRVVHWGASGTTDHRAARVSARVCGSFVHTRRSRTAVSECSAPPRPGQPASPVWL